MLGDAPRPGFEALRTGQSAFHANSCIPNPWDSVASNGCRESACPWVLLRYVSFRTRVVEVMFRGLGLMGVGDASRRHWGSRCCVVATARPASRSRLEPDHLCHRKRCAPERKRYLCCRLILAGGNLPTRLLTCNHSGYRALHSHVPQDAGTRSDLAAFNHTPPNPVVRTLLYPHAR